MVRFSNEEKFDILTCYVLCHRNSSEAEQMYLNRYPERNQPNRRTFSKLVTNLREYGSFQKPVISRKKPSNEEKVNNVLLAVTEFPEISTRQIEQTIGTSKSTTHFILKKERMHPYKFRICQGLKEGDEVRRRSFCEWYTRKCHENNNFPHKIIWSDESMVTNNGIFNRRNTHFWSKENPRVKRMAKHQNRFGFNIWAGIYGTKIVGPFLYHGTLTSERYLNLLQHDVEEALDELPLADVNDCWFMQDGAPAHNARAVHEYLSARFPGKWIGTHSEISWPPRSPDITPMDFFIWGYIKNFVFAHNIDNEDNLRRLVLEAFARITPDMLSNALDSTVRRCYLCLETEGNLFEHLL